MNTLQSVSISDTKSRFNPQFLLGNSNIRYLRIKQSVKKEGEKLIIPPLKHSQQLSFKENWMDQSLFSFVSQWKYLKVLELSDSRQIIQENYLMTIFPKLEVLTHLYLEEISCTADTILNIPSSSLVGIKLWGNRKVQNKCIEKIDSKWPYLTEITIHNCPRVDGRIFAQSKFRCLIILIIDVVLLNESKYTLHYLKRRGVQVLLT